MSYQLKHADAHTACHLSSSKRAVMLPFAGRYQVQNWCYMHRIASTSNRLCEQATPAEFQATHIALTARAGLAIEAALP